MAIYPAAFGFSSEYRGDNPAYDGFDEYLRVEFPKRQPGWEPRFGLSGSVPDAESQADAERKVAQLLHDIAREFKAFRPDVKKVLPEPITKVWRWHQ